MSREASFLLMTPIGFGHDLTNIFTSNGYMFVNKILYCHRASRVLTSIEGSIQLAS